MEPKKQKNQLFITIVLLGVWLSLSIGSLLLLNPESGVLAIALFSFTTLIVLFNVLNVYGWILIIIGLFTFAFSEFTFWGISRDFFLNISVYFVGLIGTIILGRLVVRRVNSVYDENSNMQKVISELTTFENTGLVKWQYAQSNLNLEISRSQRYKKPLCFFLLQVKNVNGLDDENSFDDAKKLMEIISTYFKEALRGLDIATQFNDITIGAILPETSKDGCKKVVERFHLIIEQKMRIPLLTGIAVFPQDGVSNTQIITAAEIALDQAKTSGKSIVFFDSVQGDDGDARDDTKVIF